MLPHGVVTPLARGVGEPPPESLLEAASGPLTIPDAKDAAALAEIRRKFNDDKPGGWTDKPEVAEPKAKATAAAK